MNFDHSAAFRLCGVVERAEDRSTRDGSPFTTITIAVETERGPKKYSLSLFEKQHAMFKKLACVIGDTVCLTGGLGYRKESYVDPTGTPKAAFHLNMYVDEIVKDTSIRASNPDFESTLQSMSL